MKLGPVLSVSCPTCDAKAGQPCRVIFGQSAGTEAQQAHNRRFVALHSEQDPDKGSIMTPDRIHYNLDATIVAFEPFTDEQEAAVIKAVTDALDRFRLVDFVEFVTVGAS